MLFAGKGFDTEREFIRVITLAATRMLSSCSQETLRILQRGLTNGSTSVQGIEEQSLILSRGLLAVVALVDNQLSRPLEELMSDIITQP